MIEHEWYKLKDMDKNHYINYASYIISIHGESLEKIFKSIKEKLPMCIYAITNEKSYDRSLEQHVEKFLNISLNINDPRTE